MWAERASEIVAQWDLTRVNEKKRQVEQKPKANQVKKSEVKDCLKRMK